MKKNCIKRKRIPEDLCPKVANKIDHLLAVSKMDAYIPQYKLSLLIKQSIGDELTKHDFKLTGQSDNVCHYLNQYIEMNISYFHKEIGITFKVKEKIIFSNDIINKLFYEKQIEYKSENNFKNIEEYFKYLLKNEFLNVEKCMPNVFYGEFNRCF